MDLRTNVIVKGEKALQVYQTIINSSKNTPSHVSERRKFLDEYSKKIKEKKNNFDTDNLNPFECTYATFVSEDLSFVYEFK